jgi:hypothetical protein
MARMMMAAAQEEEAQGLAARQTEAAHTCVGWRGKEAVRRESLAVMAGFRLCLCQCLTLSHLNSLSFLRVLGKLRPPRRGLCGAAICLRAPDFLMLPALRVVLFYSTEISKEISRFPV